MDTGVVKCTSPLIVDNFVPILEILAEKEKVHVELPGNEEGLQMLVDVANLFKLICWGFYDGVLKINLAEGVESYYTGPSDTKKRFRMEFWPGFIEFKKSPHEEGFFGVKVYNEKQDFMYLQGRMLDEELTEKVYNDWYFIKDIQKHGYLSRHPLWDSMIRFFKGRRSFDVGLYYYSEAQQYNPKMHEIASEEVIEISEEAYTLLSKAWDFRETEKLARGFGKREPAYDPKPRKFRSYR